MRQLNTTATGRERVGLAVLLLVCTLAGVDLGANLLAVNELTRRLDMSATQKLWVQDVYTFVMAGLLVAMGGLGDRIGRRRLLMLGAAGFATASLVAAFATSADLLIAARAALGVAGATLMPSTLGLIRGMFHVPEQRRAAIAATVAGVTVGSAVGPLIGGVLLAVTTRPTSVYLISVPGMIALLVLGRFLLPEIRNPDAPPFDLVSAALSVGAVFPVVYGLKTMTGSGIGLLPIAAVLAGGAFAAAFVARQLTLPRPLIDLWLLRHPTFGAAIVLNLLVMFVLMGFSPLLMEYLQAGAGLDPAVAGVVQIASPVVMVLAITGATLLARRGLRTGTLMIGGFAVATLGMVALTQVTAGTGALLVMVGASLLAAGAGVATALVADTMVATAPQQKAAAAGALSETGKELGSALGMAVLGSIGAAAYSMRMDATAPEAVPATALDAARETIGAALATAAELPGGVGAALAEAARQASAQAINVVGVAGAVALIAGAVIAAASMRRTPRHAAPATAEPSTGRLSPNGRR
ncbi:MFS transporter [Nonomuraea diastatica]|uniref:MFS transporter n=1 Tax=Nonomuraea diastatica TaxID=1848329 RepID=A0A4R4X179_9ACTN|nr:MFS transporter [Nonomuraea diastatica]TDD23891.1 MFS transporter [Nonomuraea diastatica]